MTGPNRTILLAALTALVVSGLTRSWDRTPPVVGGPGEELVKRVPTDGASPAAGELAALRRQVGDLRRQLEASVETREHGPASNDAAAVPIQEQSETTDEVDVAAAYPRRLNEVFQAEPSDPDWNPAPELAAQLSPHLAADVTMRGLECRRSMCRLQTEHADNASVVQFQSNAFDRKRPGGIWQSSVYYDLSQVDQEPATLVAYLVREGYEAPNPNPQ